MSRINRLSLVVLGSLFLGLGIIGVIIPILPTTPFLLVAASCYARSSQKLYHWLLGNNWLGKYVKDYKEGKGLPIKIKIISVTLLWLTISYTIFYVTQLSLLKIFLITVAVSVTLYIFSIKTIRS
jgi:uncharacterized membrane protein YbaN (DUF454 family)